MAAFRKLHPPTVKFDQKMTNPRVASAIAGDAAEDYPVYRDDV